MASIHSKQDGLSDEDLRVAFILVGHDDSENAQRQYLLDSEIPFYSIRDSSDDELKPYLSMEGSATGSLPYIVLYRSDGTLLDEGGNPKIVNHIARLVRGEIEEEE